MLKFLRLYRVGYCLFLSFVLCLSFSAEVLAGVDIPINYGVYSYEFSENRAISAAFVSLETGLKVYHKISDRLVVQVVVPRFHLSTFQGVSLIKLGTSLGGEFAVFGNIDVNAIHLSLGLDLDLNYSWYGDSLGRTNGFYYGPEVKTVFHLPGKKDPNIYFDLFVKYKLLAGVNFGHAFMLGVAIGFSLF